MFKGDLHFYTGEGDLRGRVQRIDTARCLLCLAYGRVRLFVHAGGSTTRAPDPRRAAPDHAGLGPLPR